ncbi:MAG TPA: ATP-binding protein [Clostridia bacterium]|nr:ATP-binding protein [Clostridia bacterium]
MGTNKKIAVLSGKGGTGKTLVSVNLATAEANSYYVDCDVEEPNGHLYFNPQICEEKAVSVLIPKVNHELCTGCKECVNFCKFNALAFGKKVMLFKEICHSCGGCALVCSVKAITETEKMVGIVNIGVSDQVKTVGGMMNTGEASGIPIIKNILEYIKDKSGYVFIDCPPGSACIVMESIKDADYCILVAEPTIFGAHNLAMVYELVRLFDKPCGVVLNKCTDGHNPSEEFCKEKSIEILVKIPFDMELGELNSNGKIAVRENYKNKELFYSLLTKVKEAVE